MSVRVRSLLGHEQVTTAVACLGSLLRQSVDRIELVLHDDGSLTESDQEDLRAALETIRILPRQEADERTEELLARHPHCRAFRQSNPLGLKLLDVMLLEKREALAYCDADILFLRPFEGLFRFSAPKIDAVFMADRSCAYSVRSWDLLLERRLRLAARVNSGIVHFRSRAYDLDRIEWFLDRWRRAPRTPVWAEQTVWALLGGAVSTHLYDSGQVAFPTAGPPVSKATAALHFISPLRERLAAFLDESPLQRDVEPVVLRTHRARQCSVVAMAATEALRRGVRLVSDGRRCP
jgi:hypothetical protein